MIILDNENPIKPLKPEGVYTGSAYTAEIKGVPPDIDGYTVTGVKLFVTNADSVQTEAVCRKRDDGIWSATIGGASFEHYGIVSNGLRIAIEGAKGTDTKTWIRGVGEFVVESKDTSVDVPGGGGSGGAVSSVNGKVGIVVLTASDVGAVSSLNGDVVAEYDDDSLCNELRVEADGGSVALRAGDADSPDICVDFGGDTGKVYLGFPCASGTLALASQIPSVPVTKVNNKTGAVVLGASDVGALPKTGTAAVDENWSLDEGGVGSIVSKSDNVWKFNGTASSASYSEQATRTTELVNGATFDAATVETGADGNARIVLKSSVGASLGALARTEETQYPFKTVTDGDTLANCAVNVTTTGGDFTIPSATGRVRDFIFVLDVLSNQPSVAFLTGSAEIYPEDNDSVWTPEDGKLNFWMWTEVSQNKFVVARRAFAPAD